MIAYRYCRKLLQLNLGLSCLTILTLKLNCTHANASRDAFLLFYRLAIVSLVD